MVTMNTSAVNSSICPDNPAIFTTVVPILFSLVVLIGFIGNMLVLIVIISNVNMRNTTNILIGSLAAADLLFIIFCVPLTALLYIFHWIFGLYACILFQYLTFVTAYGSVYTLVLMSVDRYLAVVHPIRSIDWRTQRNAGLSVGIMWLCICICHVPFAADVGVVQLPDCYVCSERENAIECSRRRSGVCLNRKFQPNITTGVFSASGVVFYTTFNIAGYALPFVVIICLYVLLLRRLMRGRTSKLTQSTESAKSKRRVTRMVVIVIVIFGTCWLPIHSVFAMQIWHGDVEQQWFRLLQVLAQVLAYVNSCVNPILYAFLSDNFRQAFAKLLGIRLNLKTNCRTVKMQQQQQQKSVPNSDKENYEEKNGFDKQQEQKQPVNNEEEVDEDEDENEEMKPLRLTLELSADVHRDGEAGCE